MVVNNISFNGQIINRLQSKWDLLFEKDRKEWISVTPKLGLVVYVCYACKDMFSSKKTFLDHVNRRAIILTYNCKGCKQTVKYYNRCALLLHLRTHFNQLGGEIDLTALSVQSLPIGLAGFQPLSYIPTIYNDSEEEINKNLIINSLFYLTDYKNRGTETIRLRPSAYRGTFEGTALTLRQICAKVPKCEFINAEPETGVKDEPESPKNSKVYCNECNEPLKCSPSYHFLGENRPIDETLRCRDCSLILTSNCALKAHQRLHGYNPPFICPDCGLKFPSRRDLDKHDEEKCCHQSKSMRYRCPAMRCGKLFTLSTTFATHLAVHIQQLYQCNVCKKIFNKIDDFERHKPTHNGEECSLITGDNMKYCNVCKKAVGEPLEAHIQAHSIDITKTVYIYICKGCRNHFRSITTFVLHKMSKKCGKGASKGNEVQKFVIKECATCKERVICRDDKAIVGCAKCQTTNKAVETKFMCILCNQTISAGQKIVHTKKCKYGRMYVNVERMDFRGMMEQQGRKRKLRTTTSTSPAKKSVEVVRQLEEKVKFDGVYVCKICEFREQNRSDFHKHIVEHRDISTAYQCMECGECFVVKPSLVKHLKHFHEVTNVEEYFDKNQCFDKEAVKELEESMKLAPGEVKGPLKENQCRVCREEFGNSVELNKHFRIHGMAFLMRNAK